MNKDEAISLLVALEDGKLLKYEPLYRNAVQEGIKALERERQNEKEVAI